MMSGMMGDGGWMMGGMAVLGLILAIVALLKYLLPSSGRD